MSTFNNFLRRAAAKSARALLASALFAMLAPSFSLFAQQSPLIGDSKKIPDEERVIGSVNVNIEGKQTVSKEAVYAHIRLRKGMKFDQRALDQSIRSIYSTGFYDFVDAKRKIDAKGNLELDFTIIPKFKVSQIAFNGNKVYSGARKRKSKRTRARRSAKSA